MIRSYGACEFVMRFMLDTVILIYLVNDETAFEALKSTAEAGTITIVLTHIQVNQLSARPSDWDRLSAIPHEIQPTHAAVYGRSVYGGAFYGDAGGKLQEIIGQGRSAGNLDDALIGVSLGIVDARLVQTCPQIGLSLGDRVLVGHEDFTRYAVATLEYAKLLLRRVAGHYGIVR